MTQTLDQPKSVPNSQYNEMLLALDKQIHSISHKGKGTIKNSLLEIISITPDLNYIKPKSLSDLILIKRKTESRSIFHLLRSNITKNDLIVRFPDVDLKQIVDQFADVITLFDVSSRPLINNESEFESLKQYYYKEAIRRFKIPKS